MRLPTGPAIPKVLFGLLGVSLVVKLLLASPDRVFEPHDMAMEWLRSGQLRYMHLDAWHVAYQLPLYACVVALFQLVGLGSKGVLAFQVLCGTFAAWYAYRLVLLAMPNRPHVLVIATATGVFTALCPFLAIYQMRMVHPFGLEMLLAVAALLTAARASQGDRRAVLPWALCLGLLLVLRPPLAALVVPYAPSALRASLRSKAWPVLALAGLLLVGPVTAWSVRNALLLGTPVLTTATGQNLWLGIQPATEGTAQLPDGRNFVALLPGPEQEALRGMVALEQSRFFTRKWASAVTGAPGKWVRMFLIKLRNFWLFRPHAGVDHPGALARTGVIAFKVYAGLLLPLVLWSVVRGNKDVRRLFLGVLLYSAVHAFFYVESRHRLVIEPVLFALACAAVTAGPQAWTGKGPKPDARQVGGATGH